MDLMQAFNMVRSMESEDQQLQRYQQAQQQDQDLKVASAINSKLQEFKDDPARYQAFTKTFIDPNPQIKSALERVYTPKGLAAMLDTSLMETPEQRFQRKQAETISTQRATKIGEAAAENDPTFITLTRAKKEREQQDANRLALNEANVEAERQKEINRQVASADAEMAKMKSTSGQWLKQQKIEDERAKEVPNFMGSYNQLIPEAVAILGRDPDSTTTMMEKIQAGKAGQGFNNIDFNADKLNTSYFKARLAPPDARFPHPMSGKLIDEDEYKKTESLMLQALMTNSKYSKGKSIPLTSQDREAILDGLRNNPILGGASPLILSAMPFAFDPKDITANKRLKELQNELRVKFGYNKLVPPTKTTVQND